MDEPLRHLLDVILPISGMVGIFGKINMKALGTFGTETICWTSQNNCSNVVLHRMKFRNVEMFSNPGINKVLFVLVEGDPCFIKLDQGVHGVWLKVSIINKIKTSMNGTNQHQGILSPCSCIWSHSIELLEIFPSWSGRGQFLGSWHKIYDQSWLCLH